MPASALHRRQRRGQPSRRCEECGGVFTRKPGSHETHAHFRARRYCSRRCKVAAGKQELRDRFEAKVRRDPFGCWEWTGAKANGYGVIGKGARDEGLLAAHVVGYELDRGSVPDGLVLDHLCRNPGCVNPDHLEPVTAAENARRGARAKITERDAATIRAMVADGQSQAGVARFFDLHPCHVSRIVAGKRWSTEAKPITRKRRARA